LIRFDLQGRFYPNVIALTKDERIIYVAYGFGIAILNPNDGSVSELIPATGISLAQVDGLYFRDGTLIAIQNGFGANRIVELDLAPDGDRVTGGRLLEYRSPNMESPTTGAICNGKFYFIVNSQTDHEEDGRLLESDELRPIQIAQLRLQ